MSDSNLIENSPTEWRTKRKKRSTLILLGCTMILILGSVYVWFLLNPTLTADTSPAKRGKAISAVYGTVSVEPIAQTIVRSQLGGVISSLKVKVGDVVKQGQVIAETTDVSSKAQVQQLLNDLETERRRHSMGPPAAPAAESKRVQVEQLKKLLNEGNIARSEYDRNLSELQTLEDRVKAEQLALDAVLKTAEQKVDSAISVEKQLMLVSPQDGVVLEVYAQLGEIIVPRTQILLIGSSACHLKAQINEEDIGLLQNGMKAAVRLYSYAKQDFTATLKEILPQGDNQSYRAILTLDNPPERLLPGMTGELNIIIGVHENALIIPTRALRADRTVLVVENGIVRKRKVEVGFRSIEKAEILSGLQDEEHVILNDLDLFRVGQKVRKQVRLEE